MNQPKPDGIHYLFRGLQLIQKPGIRPYVVIPFIINLALMAYGIYYAMSFVPLIDTWLNNNLWEWLAALVSILIWPIALIASFLIASYLFAIFANWIAAPFNGLLSDAVERHLSGHTETHTWAEYVRSLPQLLLEIIKELPRVLWREVQKLLYFIPRALVFGLCFFLLPVFGQILWFLFSSWMMSVQYVDYPMDNNKAPFPRTIAALKSQRVHSLSFGGAVMVVTMIPLINLFIMPIAVAGGTALWFDHYREKTLDNR